MKSRGREEEPDQRSRAGREAWWLRLELPVQTAIELIVGYV